MKTTHIPVQFTYLLERDPSYLAEPMPVELRAEVTLGDNQTEPVVVPLDKAVWQDALGPEVVFGAQSPFWQGAEEAAIDSALAAVTRESERLPVEQRRAS